MHRSGPFGGRSKATASTVCQKCLKRDIYECTVSAQERPYKARPSRTQQLLNPNLKQKLTTEVPNELLRKKGVADELLAKKEEERGRRGSRGGSRKRSYSTSSSDSVSTISTNRSRSRSRSPARKRRELTRMTSPHRGRDQDALRKRNRSASSDSYNSKTGAERNVRRRMSSFSPPQRGRSRSFGSDCMDTSHRLERRERNSRRHPSEDRSSSRRRARRRSRSGSPASGAERQIRYLFVSQSPSRSPDRMDTSQERVPDRRAPRPGRSRSRGRRGHSPRSMQRSPSPYGRRTRGRPRSPSPFRPRNGVPGRLASPRGRRERPLEENQPVQTQRAASPPRERSLSPYSKRLALTRQMQAR